jgi:hypothetical protein
VIKRVRILLLVALSVFAALFIACDDDDEVTGTPTPTASASAAPTASPTSAATPTATAADVCQENPDPATEEQVQVISPEPGDEVTSPVTVTGLVAAFEAQFNIAIKDADGNDVVAEVSAMSSEGQTLAPFSVDIIFVATERTRVCLWVFDYSAMDGSIENVHQVPIVLLP